MRDTLANPLLKHDPSWPRRDVRQRVNEVEDRHVVGEVPTPHAQLASEPSATNALRRGVEAPLVRFARQKFSERLHLAARGDDAAGHGSGRPGRSSMRSSSASSSAEASGPENPLISRTILRIRSVVRRTRSGETSNSASSFKSREPCRKLAACTPAYTTFFMAVGL